MFTLINFLLFNIFIISFTGASNVLDLNLYETVLDPQKCESQLSYIIQNNTALRSLFMDASMRTPRGIFQGNMIDMGNYFQCLEISTEQHTMLIEGKYCVINLPLNQSDFEMPSLPNITLPEFPWPEIDWPQIPWPELNPKTTVFNGKLLKDLRQFKQGKRGVQELLGENDMSRIPSDSPLSGMEFELAICIPKVCSTRQALDILTMNLTSSLEYREAFCRLPNDKPWSVADYVAIVIFSIIGLLTLISTGYDIRHSVILENDPKKANKMYLMFSVYTNTRKFFTFHSNPNAINCLDGIRSFAMLWVIVGHTFFTQVGYVTANPLDMFNFMKAFTSLWITSGTITVDTFFMISGLLLVYTTASKMTKRSLVKNLHLFYLNRIFRMFPVLAAAVLIQASFLHRTADGPYWQRMVINTEDCRNYWWSTLLYVQNFVNPSNMCLGHTWYLAVDMQLYILSPIVLFWVYGGNKKSAWTALIGTLVAVIAASTIYNFINNFHSATVSFSRPEESVFYMTKYYLHTLPRAAPFFVGMCFGYILHVCRGRTIKLPKVLVAIFWLLATVASSTVVISAYFVMQEDWDNQIVDNVLNSFMRPAWAASVAWMVFACTHGYAGPISWVLSLHVFKILGRLSYAMYILHFPLIYLLNSTTLAPIYFSVHFSMHKFLVDLSFAIISAFLVTIFIDLPFSSLIGLLLGGSGAKKKNDDLKRNVEVGVMPPVENEKKTRL